MKFTSTLLVLAQLSLAWTTPTGCKGKRQTSQLYKLRADAPNAPFDDQFLHIDPLSNDFASVHFIGTGTDLQVSATPGTTPNTYTLSVAPTKTLVLSGYLSFFQGLAVVNEAGKAAYTLRYGQFTIDPPLCEGKKHQPHYLGYETLPNSQWIAYSPNGGLTYLVALYNATSGNPPPIPEGQAFTTFKLEVVKA